MDYVRKFLLKCLRRDGEYMEIRSGILFDDVFGDGALAHGVQQLRKFLELELRAGMSIDEFSPVSDTEKYLDMHIKVDPSYNCVTYCGGRR